jgi:hypothetical protein
MITSGTATQLSFSDQLDSSAPLSLQDAATARVLNDLSPLAGHIAEKYNMAKAARRPHELRWINAWRNYRGKPGSTTFISTEKSKAFIKISKTKMIAVYGQLTEVLFPNDRIPIEITASPQPLGAPEYVHIDMDDPIDPNEVAQQEPDVALAGYPGDGRDLKPGETLAGRLMDWVKDKVGSMAKVKEGPGNSPGRIILKPAEEAAAFANKRIHDQFEEMGAVTIMREAAFECPLLGTGILKGPFSFTVEQPDWDAEGTYIGRNRLVPRLNSVSVWDIFPESEARSQKEIEWLIQRHKLSESQLHGLKKHTGFRATAIDNLIARMPNYVKEDYENLLDENQDTVSNDRFEVLEYWGPISRTLAGRQGIVLFPKGWPEGVDEVQVNAWVSGGEWLRCVINPFLPYRLPYYFVPYEYNPYSPFGIGVIENMEDTQELMNGFMRLAVDNAVLSGSVMLEIDESVMQPGQDYSVATGKIWRKNTTTQQAAVRSIQIQNISQQNMQMFDAARRLADESTGVPSFSHGMTGVQGVGRTAGGISMLMGAASTTIKTTVKNFDDYWFKPIGQATYYWNMNNDFDKRMLGDITVVAKGSASLMQKEIKSQRLLQFGQVVASMPMASAWINWKQWDIELGDSLEVDTKSLINRPEEYQLQLQTMQMMNAKGPGMANQPADPNAPSAPGGQPMGAPATPGQQGFSGTPQGGMSGATNGGAAGQEAGAGEQ